MTFTYNTNEEIEFKIKSDLNYIKTKIKKVFSKRVFALVLIGGFGRGEGTVLQKPIQIVNDYDILIITKSFCLSQQKLNKLKLELAKDLNIRFVDLAFKNYFSLPFSFYNMLNYDSKFGSYVFYGDKDIMDLMPNYTKGTMSFKEGENLLFNRLINPFEFLSPNILLGKENNFLFNIQISKFILACVDIININKGKYSYKYEFKFKIFQNLDKNYLDQKKLNTVKQAFEYKLNPSKTVVNSKQFLVSALIFFNYTIKEVYLKKNISKFSNRHKLNRILNIKNWILFFFRRKSYFSYYSVEINTLKLIKALNNDFDNKTLIYLAKFYKMRFDPKNVINSFIDIKNKVVSDWLKIHH